MRRNLDTETKSCKTILLTGKSKTPNSLTVLPSPVILLGMSRELFGRTINKIGVIGSGQIGPDIALYFTKVLSPFGVQVVVNDISEEALASGKKKFDKKIDKGVETGAFKPAKAQAMKDHVTFTTDKGQLAGADFIVEAATEDLNIKKKIFADVAAACSPETILASNSSHLEPERIFEGIANPERTLVIHYFFPAERNPLVEVVPGEQTSPDVTDFCMKFYESIGKVPIQVGSQYGYAIDPIFEGIFLAALKLADAGMATHKEIDAVAQKVLGLGIGPFTAMNLTGGTPLTKVGLANYTEKIMPWYVAPESMNRTDPWPTAKRGEKVEVSEEIFEKVGTRLQGAYFGLVSEVLESGITNVSDLNMAVEIGLVMRAPFRMMNKVGVAEARNLVEEYAAENPGFKVAECLKKDEPWMIRHIHRKDRGNVAVVTVRRPRTLNALNREIYQEMRAVFKGIREDQNIVAAVITGFGVKAFVSGADIGMLERVESEEEGAAISWESQEAMLEIQQLGKPVVAALNGLALGGGSELALACTARIARKGLKVCFGQPEVNLGIIPGAGATQRLPRVIGMAHAWDLLRTGRTVSGDEAEELGYLRKQVEGDLVAHAIELARELSGETPGQAKEPPPDLVTTMKEIDIQHRSRKVDEILRKAIIEGCAKPIEEGVRFESDCFGEVCGTKDKKIGIENFRKTQLREPAQFVHA